MTAPPSGPGHPFGPGHPGNNPEERDSGLARERTALAWTRTALSFAVLGGTVLKANVLSGLVILAVAPVIWQLGRVARGPGPRTGRPAVGPGPRTGLPAVGPARLFLIAVSVVVVALICLAVVIWGKAAPGALR